jgi:hypothetical protein
MITICWSIDGSVLYAFLYVIVDETIGHGACMVRTPLPIVEKCRCDTSTNEKNNKIWENNVRSIA